MRSDLAQVVTERPRRGHHITNDKTARTLHKDEYALDDHGPTRAPCRMHDKEFSDLLGPLRGVLRKNVGRPWNKIHSELSAVLDKRSITGQHIWDHVRWEVEANTFMGADKQVFTSGHFGGPELPVDGRRLLRASANGPVVLETSASLR